MNRIKKIWMINALIIVGAILFSLVIAEIGLRLNTHEKVVYDPVMRNRHIPGGDYDSRGFRNPKAIDQAAIVAIGDSQTEGNNALSSEAWPHVLARLATTTAYSMAIGGYGPVQYAALAPEALALNPSLVIVGLYLGNDLTDAEILAYDFPQWANLRDTTYDRPAPLSVASTTDFRTLLGSGVLPGSFSYKLLKIRMWIRANVRVYALLGNATRDMRESLGLAKTRSEKQEGVRDLAKAYPDIAYVYDTNPALETVLSPSYRLDTVDLESPQANEGWRISKDRLRIMKNMFDDAGVRFAILVIPTKEKVYLEYMKTRGEDAPAEFETYDKKETELLEEINSFCSEEGLVCFSALEPMVSAMGSGIVVYGTTMDGHPKAAGYRVIAEGLFKDLSVRGLLLQ